MNETLTLDARARPDQGRTAARLAAFERAARSSRRVRRLRVALPLASLAVVLLAVALGVLARIELGFNFAGVDITADGISMDAPKLSGSDGKGRTYEVTAESAVQDLADPTIVRLFGIKAEVHQTDGRWAEFSADSGVYDAGAERLRLDENIRIRSSENYAADLSKAEIDLATGKVDSDAPVAFSSTLGAVEAQGMQVDEKGGTVTFSDGVKMTVDPNAVDGGNAGQEQP